MGSRWFGVFCLVAAVCCCGCGPGRGSREETYPNRPIRLVVPFGAGGGSDAFARIIKKAIEDHDLLPQPLVIVNRDGAGATIGSRMVRDARPDGYTLLLLHDAILTAKYAGVVAYGPEAFEPVAATGEVGMVIAVGPNSPYENLTELLEAARQRPGTITFGANLGALTHFAGLQLEAAFPGARFRFVQHGGGAGRYAALMGGHIDVTGFSTEEFLRFAPGGLRGLAYFGERRHPKMADVPTAREQGFDIIARNTFYWWAPKGTPRDRIAYIAAVLQKAMSTEEVRTRLQQIHATPTFLTGEALLGRLREDEQRIALVSPRDPTEIPDFAMLAVVAVALAGVACLVETWAMFRSGRRASGESAERCKKKKKVNEDRLVSRSQQPIPNDPAGHNEHTHADHGSRSTYAGTSTRWERWCSPRVRAALTFLLSVGYVSALPFAWPGFIAATSLFVFCAVCLLSGFRRVVVVPAAVLAITVAVGLYGTLTQLLGVPLPGSG